jgi:hypothetical protein
MRRPERPAPGDPVLTDEDRRTAGRLLATLRDEAPPHSPDLFERIRRRVRDGITLRDLVDVSTSAFVHAMILPVAERVATLFRSRSAPVVSPNAGDVSPGSQQSPSAGRHPKGS